MIAAFAGAICGVSDIPVSFDVMNEGAVAGCNSREWPRFDTGGLMRQRISSFLLVAAAVLILGGCVVEKSFREENYTSLKPGMSKAQVQEKMGKPMGTDIKGTTEIWKYDRHDPISSRFERIELRFENGVYQDMTKSSPPN